MSSRANSTSGKACVFGYTPPYNMTGQPSLSLPLGLSSDKPRIGTTIPTGRFGDEATLFRLAGQLEQATAWNDEQRAKVWG